MRTSWIDVEDWIAALAARDKSTCTHGARVGQLASLLAERAGLAPATCLQIESAGALHDLGKMAIPDAILNKPGTLTSDEMSIMATHSELGSSLLRRIPQLEPIAVMIHWHHERFDGGGYPDGIAGHQIPFEVRIITVCDAWDAMTHDRPYRSALSPVVARAVLAAGAGTQWCPHSVELLLSELGIDASDAAINEDLVHHNLPDLQTTLTGTS